MNCDVMACTEMSSCVLTSVCCLCQITSTSTLAPGMAFKCVRRALLHTQLLHCWTVWTRNNKGLVHGYANMGAVLFLHSFIQNLRTRGVYLSTLLLTMEGSSQDLQGDVTASAICPQLFDGQESFHHFFFGGNNVLPLPSSVFRALLHLCADVHYPDGS